MSPHREDGQAHTPADHLVLSSWRRQRIAHAKRLGAAQKPQVSDNNTIVVLYWYIQDSV